MMNSTVSLREILSDNTISLDAKGLYCMIEACGQDKLDKKLIAEKVRDKEVFESAWEELAAAGYIQ